MKMGKVVIIKAYFILCRLLTIGLWVKSGICVFRQHKALLVLIWFQVFHPLKRKFKYVLLLRLQLVDNFGPCMSPKIVKVLSRETQTANVYIYLSNLLVLLEVEFRILQG